MLHHLAHFDSPSETVEVERKNVSHFGFWWGMSHFWYTSLENDPYQNFILHMFVRRDTKYHPRCVHTKCAQTLGYMFASTAVCWWFYSS